MENLQNLDFQITCYQIKATPKNGQEHYYIYNGQIFLNKQIAESICEDCNKLWGGDINFEIIEIIKK